jgi:hypothetical protein
MIMAGFNGNGGMLPMDALQSIFKVVGSTLSLVFPFWPFLWLTPLVPGDREVLNTMLGLWAAFLLCWLASRAVGLSAPPSVRLIPEPYSTYLFFATGAVLFITRVIRK